MTTKVIKTLMSVAMADPFAKYWAPRVDAGALSGRGNNHRFRFRFHCLDWLAKTPSGRRLKRVYARLRRTMVDAPGNRKAFDTLRPFSVAPCRSFPGPRSACHA